MSEPYGTLQRVLPQAGNSQDEHGDVRGAIPSIEAEVIDQDPDNDENDDSDYSPTHRKAHSETRSGGRPRAQSLRGGKKGKKPLPLTRTARANIRVMFAGGATKTIIANKLGITQPRVNKTLDNDYRIPDHVDSDDEWISDKSIQTLKPAGSGRPRKVVAGPSNVEAKKSSSVVSSSSKRLTLQSFLRDLNPPMPELLQPLKEAGVTDDTMRALIAWPQGEINEFFEELIKPRILDRFQSFVVKRALLALSGQRNEDVA